MKRARGLREWAIWAMASQNTSVGVSCKLAQAFLQVQQGVIESMPHMVSFLKQRAVVSRSVKLITCGLAQISANFLSLFWPLRIYFMQC